MTWISVYREVNGPKLRRLTKALDTGRAEALGLLCFLWFWGLDNADKDGKILFAERDDICDAFNGVTDIPEEKIVCALFSTGWLDEHEDGLYIHDWDIWQEQWYKLADRRERDNERKRKSRKKIAELLTNQTEIKLPEQAVKAVTQAKPDPKGSQEPENANAKKDKPKKKRYADFVAMTEEEYQKLCDKYGSKFADACIETLNNYKGAKGKKYANDYLAILNWVVSRVSEKNPKLYQESKAASGYDDGGNPFAEYRGDG